MKHFINSIFNKEVYSVFDALMLVICGGLIAKGFVGGFIVWVVYVVVKFALNKFLKIQGGSNG